MGRTVPGPIVPASGRRPRAGRRWRRSPTAAVVALGGLGSLTVLVGATSPAVVAVGAVTVGVVAAIVVASIAARGVGRRLQTTIDELTATADGDASAARRPPRRRARAGRGRLDRVGEPPGGTHRPHVDDLVGRKLLEMVGPHDADLGRARWRRFELRGRARRRFAAPRRVRARRRRRRCPARRGDAAPHRPGGTSP